MLYWLPNTAASSVRLYWESFHSERSEEVKIPMGWSAFPKKIFPMSQRGLEKCYTQMVYCHELEAGGHFAAFEQAEVFVNGWKAGQPFTEKLLLGLISRLRE